MQIGPLVLDIAEDAVRYAKLNQDRRQLFGNLNTCCALVTVDQTQVNVFPLPLFSYEV